MQVWISPVFSFVALLVIECCLALSVSHRVTMDSLAWVDMWLEQNYEMLLDEEELQKELKKESLLKDRERASGGSKPKRVKFSLKSLARCVSIDLLFTAYLLPLSPF